MKQLSKKFLKHSLFLGFEVLAGCVAAVFLLWLAMIWRLSQGPIDIDFFTETLEKAFSKEMNVDFGQTQIVWGGYQKPIEIHVTDVSIETKRHRPVFSIDSIGVHLSKRSLMLGKIRAKSLTLYSPTLRVLRDKTGSFKLDLNNGNGALKTKSLRRLREEQELFEAETEALYESETLGLEAFLKLVEGEQDPDSALAVLKHLSVRGANIVFQDQLYGGIWRSKSSNITIKKGARGATMAATAQVVVGDEMMAIKFNGFHGWKNGETQSIVTFNRIDPKTLAHEYKYLEFLKGVDLKLSGGIHVTLNKQLKPVRGRLLLDAGKGLITYDQLHKTALPVTSAELKYSFDFAQHSSEIETLVVNLGKAKLSVDATTELQEGRHKLNLKAILEGMRIDDLETYWPSELAPKPRKWVVTHLSKGIASKATLNTKASMAFHDFSSFKLDSLHGHIDFTGIKVDYLPPMPAVINTGGTAIYDENKFVLDINQGALKDMTVLKSNILINGFENRKAKINIDVDVQGPIQSALTVLASKPLHFMDDFPAPIETIQGQTNIDLNLHFPLKKGLKLHDIKVNADAVLTDVVFPELVNDMTLAGGPLTLSVNPQKMNVTGQAMLSGVNTTFDWMKNFDKNADYTSRVKAQLNLDYPFLAKIGVPDIVLFQGPMASEITYTQLQDKKSVLALKGDLVKTSFSHQWLGLVKKEGQPGALDLFLNLTDKRLTMIKSLSLNLDDFVTKGDLKFRENTNGETELDSLTFSEFKVGATDAHIGLKNNGNKKYQITIGGDIFDASQFLSEGSQVENKKNMSEIELEKSSTRFEMAMDVRKLVTSPKTSLNKAKVFVDYQEGAVDRLELDARAGNGQVYLRYLPNAQGYHKLRFEADNAGAALRALNLSKTIKGGALVIDMWPLPNGGRRDMLGKALLSDFRLVNAPVLAKLFNAMSLAGMGDLLSGKGMKFSKLKSKLIWVENEAQGTQKKVRKLTVKNGRTSGSSLGLTFDGDFDKENDRLDLKGTVVPVSGVNKALSEIPLLGQILTGGGDAVFAATYSIKGSQKSPKVSVNPLAALAPGFLRKLFFEGN